MSLISYIKPFTRRNVFIASSRSVIQENARRNTPLILPQFIKLTIKEPATKTPYNKYILPYLLQGIQEFSNEPKLLPTHSRNIQPLILDSSKYHLDKCMDKHEKLLHKLKKQSKKAKAYKKKYYQAKKAIRKLKLKHKCNKWKQICKREEEDDEGREKKPHKPVITEHKPKLMVKNIDKDNMV